MDILYRPSTANCRRAGFTLVELLVVMSIIILMVGIGTAAFKGGASADASRGASVVVSGECSLARNQAIMAKTLSRVIIDTAWNSTRPDLVDHYLRRMTVAFLNPTGVNSSNVTVTADSSNTVDPTNPANWVQVSSWTVLPGNVYFDTNYSAMHGTGMTINFGGPGVPTTGYSYYQFSANGQTSSSTLMRFSPAGGTPVTSTPAQVVVSVGRVDGSGNFQEKNTSAPTASCYGFALFLMGKYTFFQNVADIQKPS